MCLINGKNNVAKKKKKKRKQGNSIEEKSLKVTLVKFYPEEQHH